MAGARNQSPIEPILDAITTWCRWTLITMQAGAPNDSVPPLPVLAK